jgi:hypothetical protein
MSFPRHDHHRSVMTLTFHWSPRTQAVSQSWVSMLSDLYQHSVEIRGCRGVISHLREREMRWLKKYVYNITYKLSKLRAKYQSFLHCDSVDNKQLWMRTDKREDRCVKRVLTDSRRNSYPEPPPTSHRCYPRNLLATLIDDMNTFNHMKNDW